MNANKRELLLQKEVYAVVGCAIEVLNVRGHGLHEKIYENCPCVELGFSVISFGLINISRLNIVEDRYVLLIAVGLRGIFARRFRTSAIDKVEALSQGSTKF